MKTGQRDREMAKKIAREVEKAGGRVYYVGGLVRDYLMGKDSSDIDIEVHGVSPEALSEILDRLGKRTTMGVSFGIFGLRGFDLDIAMPRREHATGRGHKDFEVYVDPFIGTRGAAIRRDFTVNAMMQDVLTGEVIDHFGGREDLKAGLLRCVDPVTFAEDPLRVLRAARFAAVLGFSVEEKSVLVCRGMDLSGLSRERIFMETEKALLKAEKPSIYFEELKKMDQLSVWFPELKSLVGARQDPVWHPEGDVYVHTMAVLDAAAGHREQALYPAGLMFSALCHDFGKPVSSQREGERIHAKGHAEAGESLARSFTERITSETKLIRTVTNMTRLHMTLGKLCRKKAEEARYMELFEESVCPEDLLLLSLSDYQGKGSYSGWQIAEMKKIWEQELRLYKERCSAPAVTGADLTRRGAKPGPLLGEALSYARKLQLQGEEKEEALEKTWAFYRQLAGEEAGL